MSKNKQATLLAILILCLNSLTSCDNSDPEPIIVEEEVITSVDLTFTNKQNPQDIITASYKDVDGNKSQSKLILAANTVYSVSVNFLNEAKQPSEDLTAQISSRSQDYMVFYVPSDGLDFSYLYQDADVNNKVVGLIGDGYTGNAGSGDLTVTLLYRPTKNITGVPHPSLTDGETKLETTFEFEIQ